MKNVILLLVISVVATANVGGKGNLTCDFGTTCFPRSLCGFSWPMGALQWDCSWTRPSALIETGPDRDRSGRGAYLYGNSRKPKQPSEKYQLWSPALSKPTEAKVGCVSMYYYMHGADVVTLSVYAVYPNRKQQQELMWTASGEQGKQWLRMERDVVFPDDAGDVFQVFIEATMPDRTGSNVAGDIAIDEVFVAPGYKCSSPTADVTTVTQRTTSAVKPLTSTVSQLVGSTSVAAPSKLDDKGNFTCDFSTTCFPKSLCGFSWPTGALEWDCSSARPSVLVETGPDRDRSGRGAYLYGNSRKTKQPSEKYQLWSPALSKPTEAKVGCVSMYYYMHGADVVTLSVYAVYPNRKQLRELIWTASGEQSKQWIRMEREVAFPDDAGGEFQVFIEATMPDRTGSSVAGDIAIDDVFVTPGYKCSSPTDDVATIAQRTTSAPEPLTSTLQLLVGFISTATVSKIAAVPENPAVLKLQKTFCESNDNYYAANPGSGCRQFVQWTEENKEVRSVQDCGLGTIFDVDTCICNWDYLTKCHLP